MEFFDALANPDIPFLRYAFIAGAMASVSFGMVGSYVIVKRISYIAGAIAHSVLGGIGLSLYVRTALGLEWFEPLFGAVIAALLSAIIIGLVSLYAQEREDTVIGAIWSIGMATGLLFLAVTPGYVDPMSYLFGNILMISATDLLLVILLDLLIIAFVGLFYNKFLAVCFDEEFTRIRGIDVRFYYLLMLCLIALTIVLLVSIVGLVLVIALLTLPAAVAGHFSRRLSRMMVFSVLLCLLFISFGLGISYSFDLPSGAVIVALAGCSYLIVSIAKSIVKRKRGRI